MVVVSGSWGKNVASYPTPMVRNYTVTSISNKMCAKAILICRPNSHAFQERTLALDQAIKIGRSVARARATGTNAIFDCKVLSRHHALLWYDCGKFYLQDTKSSNGTFVNNNRLSSNENELPHEVCSGDIVQFGVDVVENNRKVTHGCIIATLKLFLPDGKEAKASPTIIETTRQGVVPLDELYKLSQVIQEASQREQCLESKLNELQHIVDETRRTAEESWQVYIGEERLLSRVAALESQLLQAGKNWGDERIREELSKFQEDRTTYQVAAKEALRKLHAERMEAVSAASEQERGRATAEEEVALIKEQLQQAHQELQDIAQRFSSEQKRADEEKTELEQREKELQARLESEALTIIDLQHKLDQFKSLISNPVKEMLWQEELEKFSMINNSDIKIKEELLAENETCDLIEADSNRSTNQEQTQQNHINLRVAPVLDTETTVYDSDDISMVSDESEESVRFVGRTTATLSRGATLQLNDTQGEHEEEENEKEARHNSDDVSSHAKEHSENLQDDSDSDEESELNEMVERTDHVDSRTLKYQFQSMQSEMKKQIEQLQQLATTNKSKIAELQKNLEDEKELNFLKTTESEKLVRELANAQQKWKESCDETKQLHTKICTLQDDLDNAEENLRILTDRVKTSPEANGITLDRLLKNEQRSHNATYNISGSSFSMEQVAALEEELVVLKERYAEVNNEKIALNKKLVQMHEQYNKLCNRSYNTMFFYIAPLVLMVLYLLVSSMFS